MKENETERYLMINHRKIFIGEQLVKEIEHRGKMNRGIFKVSLIIGMMLTFLLALIAYFRPIYVMFTVICLILLWIFITLYLFIRFRPQGTLPIVYQKGDHEFNEFIW